MKTTRFLAPIIAVAIVLSMFACSNKNESTVADTQLVGHWQKTYYYDGQFRKTPLENEWQLWLEKDSTFQYFKDGNLLDKGTWSIGHTERYFEMNSRAKYYKDSIVFVGHESTVIRYFEYPSEVEQYSLRMIDVTPIEWVNLTGGSPEYWERMVK